MSWFTIYALRDPRTNAVFYVGCTRNLNTRIVSHRSQAKLGLGSNHAKSAAFLDVMSHGLSVVVSCLEIVDSEQQSPEEREKHWIAHMLARGEPLTNIEDSPESKKRVGVISKTQRELISEGDAGTAAGRILLRIIRERGLSMRDAGAAMGLSDRSVRRVIQARLRPHAKTIIAAERVFGISPGDWYPTGGIGAVVIVPNSNSKQAAE